jgi:hypothetical protein
VPEAKAKSHKTIYEMAQQAAPTAKYHEIFDEIPVTGALFGLRWILFFFCIYVLKATGYHCQCYHQIEETHI